jgi:sec-independent protein translocase protein TatC
MTPQDDNNLLGETAKPFLKHLDDLRRALVWSTAALLIGMGTACYFAPAFFKILKAPLKGVVPNPDTFIRTLDVTGGMNVALQTIIWGGVLMSAPVIVFSICWFVFPGLTRRERRILLGGLGVAALLFITGVLMCYFRALGPALEIMLWFNSWMGIDIEYFTVTSYIGFVLKLLLSFGLTFELPIVILILGQLGIINSRQLRDKRRHAIVIILVLAAIITPTQDLVCQLILALPLIALYELCVWIIWAREKRLISRPG